MHFCILFIFTSIGSSSSETHNRGKVIRIIDGDTVIISLTNSGKSVSCRLYGIDAPETAKRDRRGQPYAMEAGGKLRKLVLGK